MLRGNLTLAVKRDVPIMYRLEEFVLDMVPKSRLVATKDATIML